MPESLREDGPPSPDEIKTESPDKKTTAPVTMRTLFGLKPGGNPEGSKQPESKDRAKASPARAVSKPAREQSEKHDHEQADRILLGWPGSGSEKQEEPVKNEAQSKAEFSANAERFLTQLASVDATARFNGSEEQYSFKCNNTFLVNGQPKPLNAIREDLKSNKISTNEISFDFHLEKLNGQNANGMKLSVPVSEFLNGGVENIQARLSKMVQNIYGAAHQGAESMRAADRSKMLTTAASEEAFRANQQLANQIKSAAGGKNCNIVEFNNPESRETLIVIDIPKKGTQISLSLNGGAISHASSNGKPLSGSPSEVLNVIKNA